MTTPARLAATSLRLREPCAARSLMAKRPPPRSILITGASSGIGEALALFYAADGITLFLNGRNEERLSAVAVACREKGAHVSTWIGDVTDADRIKAWIEECDAQAPLNLVIANAGVAVGARTVTDLHPAATRAFAANVTGVFNTVHPAVELMAARPRPVTDGQIAIMSSVMGYAGTARSPAYSSSKAAIKSYGQGLRGALRAMGIGVTVICPGYIRTSMVAMNASLPFMIEVDRTTKTIAKAIARNKARITFPWQVALIARIIVNSPGWLIDRINKPYGVPRLEREDGDGVDISS